ncbi:MAG: hypothetical protein GX557_10015 [Chloroflexi bacterium]|nr:hypothetical protein [Chloroflexota bacterium]
MRVPRVLCALLLLLSLGACVGPSTIPTPVAPFVVARATSVAATATPRPTTAPTRTGLPPTMTLVPTPLGGVDAKAIAAIRAFMLDPTLALTHVARGVHPENAGMAVEEFVSASHRFLVEAATGRVVYMHITDEAWKPAAEPVLAPEELERRALTLAGAHCPCFTAVQPKLEFRPGGKGANRFFRWQALIGDPSRPLDQPPFLQVGLGSDGTLFDYIDSGICYLPEGTPDVPTPAPEPVASPDPTAASEPTARPVPTPADTTGWQAYINEPYGFALRYPPDWTLEEDTAAQSTLRGHALRLWPTEQRDVLLAINYKASGDDRFIGRTGVGAGELVESGSVDFVGEPVARIVLVAQEEREMSVLYGGGRVLVRGDLAFTLFLDYRGDPNGPGLSAEVQGVADQIVASIGLQ